MVETEKVLAMAVAAVSMECKADFARIIVCSFQEVRESSLETYIADNKIQYHKYQLEDLEV